MVPRSLMALQQCNDAYVAGLDTQSFVRIRKSHASPTVLQSSGLVLLTDERSPTDTSGGAVHWRQETATYPLSAGAPVR